MDRELGRIISEGFLRGPYIPDWIPWTIFAIAACIFTLLVLNEIGRKL